MQDFARDDSTLENQISFKSQYRVPYIDHCYAAGLPGSVDEDLTYTPDSLAAFVDIEDVSCNTTVVTGESFFNSVAQESHSKKEKHTSKHKNIKNDDDDEYAGSVTRCICDFQHDDGFMISCDRCSVWQHVECMGLNRSSIPETYLCDLCQPRNVDKRKAIRIQTKKKEEMECSSESSDGGIQLPEVSRRGRKRKLRRDDDDDESELTSIGSNKKARKKSISNDKIDFHNENVYSKSYQYKRPRFNSSGKTVDSTACLSIKDNMNNRNITIDHSIEDICLNTYTNNVSYLLSILSNNASDEFNDQNFNDANNQSNVKNSTSPQSSSSSSWLNPALLKEQLLKVKYRATDVALNTKGVVSMETIRPGQVVGEFCGMIMTREEYEKSNSYDPLYTSVLNYTLHKNLTICVDARQWNNPMKYIRPSCSPNSKVVHMIEGNTVRLFVFASKNITSGKEITLPFLADYQNSLFEMKCACGKASCAVTKFYKAKSKNRYNKSKAISTKTMTTTTDQSQTNAVPLTSCNNGGYIDQLATVASLSSFIFNNNNNDSNNRNANSNHNSFDNNAFNSNDIANFLVNNINNSNLIDSNTYNQYIVSNNQLISANNAGNAVSHGINNVNLGNSIESSNGFIEMSNNINSRNQLYSSNQMININDANADQFTNNQFFDGNDLAAADLFGDDNDVDDDDDEDGMGNLVIAEHVPVLKKLKTPGSKKPSKNFKSSKKCSYNDDDEFTLR